MTRGCASFPQLTVQRWQTVSSPSTQLQRDSMNKDQAKGAAKDVAAGQITRTLCVAGVPGPLPKREQRP
jgi:hypothetical protein